MGSTSDTDVAKLLDGFKLNEIVIELDGSYEPAPEPRFQTEHEWVIIEFPINRFEKWRGKHLPWWIKRRWPIKETFKIPADRVTFEWRCEDE